MEVFMGGNCCVRKKLCPVSLGLAVGLVCGLGSLIWLFWVIYNGPTAFMAAAHLPVPTMQMGLLHAFWAFVKGLIFGFFVALFYDWISCCCKNKMCCKCKSDCNCSCCATDKKPETTTVIK
jgi:hypothetical protein